METKKETIVSMILNIILAAFIIVATAHPSTAIAEIEPSTVETYAGMSTEDAIAEKFVIKAFLATNDVEEETTEKVTTEKVTEKVTDAVTEKPTEAVTEEKTTETKAEENKTETTEPTTQAPVSTGSGSLLTPCGYTEEQLRNALLYNLKDYAGYFLEAEATYGVNATFLAAIAATESGWGRSELAQSRNNLYGWKGDDSYKYFDSPRDCIMHVARSLKANYLSPDGPYFRGYTIEAVNICYCGTSHWVSLVSGIMSQINTRAK